MLLNKTVFSPLKSLEGLSRMFPVQGAVVVGAGMGKGAWFDLFHQQNIEDVLLIEAEPSSVQYLEKKFNGHSRWSILEQMVGEENGEHTFYSLSNKAESTFLSPDVLKTLLPNISVREERVCQSVTLDWLAHEKILNGNWLVIDVLPALSILNGALKTLSAFDVIIMRQFIDEHLSDGFQQDIGTLMQQHGFCCFGIEQELHPSLGHAVYVKDIRGLTLDLQQIQEQSEKLQKDWLDRQSAWEREKSELLKENENVEQQLAANNRQVAELTENLQKAQQEVVDSEKECLKLTDKLKEEVQQKERLRQEEKADWAQEKSELLKERERAEQEAVAQEQRIKELTQSLTDARQELTENKHERQEFAERLKKEAEEKEAQWVEKQVIWEKMKTELFQAKNDVVRRSNERESLLQKLKVTLQQEKEGFKKIIEEKEQQIFALHQKADELVTSLESTNGALAKAKRKQSELEKQAAVWAEEQTVLKEQKEDAEIVASQLRETVEALTKKADDLQANYQATLKERNDLKQRTVEFGLKLDVLQKNLDAQAGTVAILTEEKKIQHHAITEQASECERLNQQIHTLDEKIGQRDQEVETAERRCSVMQEELNKIEMQVNLIKTSLFQEPEQ